MRNLAFRRSYTHQTPLVFITDVDSLRYLVATVIFVGEGRAHGDREKIRLFAVYL